MSKISLAIPTLLACAVGIAAPASQQAHAAPKKGPVMPNAETLKECLGDASSWTPPVLGEIKAGMSPEEVGKLIPGAQKLRFGFAKVKTKACVGVQMLEFWYMEDREDKSRKLSSVTFHFDPSLSKSEQFAQTALAFFTEKYGPVKRPEQIEKRLIVWIGDNSKTATWTLFPTRPPHWQLSVRL